MVSLSLGYDQCTSCILRSSSASGLGLWLQAATEVKCLSYVVEGEPQHQTLHASRYFTQPTTALHEFLFKLLLQLLKVKTTISLVIYYCSQISHLKSCMASSLESTGSKRVK